MSEQPYRIDARVKDLLRYYIDDREVSKEEFLDVIWTGSRFGPNTNGHNGSADHNGAD